MTKIRVINSTDPRPALAPVNGPQTAGIYFDRGTNELKIDADTSTVRSVPFGASGAVEQEVLASVTVPNTAAQTAANYPVFFTAPFACVVVGVNERHVTAGSDGSAVTLMVKKVASGTAKASGTDVLSAGINLKATADTNQAGALHGTAANLALAAGDSLALVTTGTLTAVVEVAVTVRLNRL